MNIPPLPPREPRYDAPHTGAKPTSEHAKISGSPEEHDVGPSSNLSALVTSRPRMKRPLRDASFASATRAAPKKRRSTTTATTTSTTSTTNTTVSTPLVQGGLLSSAPIEAAVLDLLIEAGKPLWDTEILAAVPQADASALVRLGLSGVVVETWDSVNARARYTLPDPRHPSASPSTNGVPALVTTRTQLAVFKLLRNADSPMWGRDILSAVPKADATTLFDLCQSGLLVRQTTQVPGMDFYASNGQPLTSDASAALTAPMTRSWTPRALRSSVLKYLAEQGKWRSAREIKKGIDCEGYRVDTQLNMMLKEGIVVAAWPDPSASRVYRLVATSL